MNSTHKVLWSDDFDSSRCQIPGNIGMPKLIPGCLGIALGIFVGSWPFLITAFFYFGMPDDEAAGEMLVLSNRGKRIVLGMPKGFYPGYDREISELYVFRIVEK
jgi:hypothetical protein